jgi:D-xylonolactonase
MAVILPATPRCRGSKLSGVSRPELLVHGYGLIEGPRVEAGGGLFFSDVTRGGVYRRDPDGGIATVVPRRRGVGGIALHADGGIVISGRDVCHVLDGTSRTLLARPEGVGGFNDLFADAAGRVWVGSLRSDPFALGPERETGECYRIDAPERAVVLYRGVGLSNGIGVSPDGRVLYHSDTALGVILAHDLAEDGGVSNRRSFAACDAPDGLAVDAEGGLWVASYGGGCVRRFDAAGKPRPPVEVPAKLVASCCFGGDDLRDLIVTTHDNTDDESRAGSIFRLRVDVPGLPPNLARI